MRILVISDTHGNSHNAEKAIEMLCPDKVIFLGDGEREMENLSYLYKDIQFYMVAGNCDFLSQLRTVDSMTVCGKRIMFTHGHPYGVKGGTGTLEKTARENGYDIVLYGHTHIPENRYDNGLYIINPGSASRPVFSRPSVAYIDFINDNILTNIVEI